MDKNYEPEKVEAKWYAEYLSRKAFRGDVRSGGDPYTVVIPPPNVTGILHMGHALNITIQDILVRWRRMHACPLGRCASRISRACMRTMRLHP